MKWLAHWKWYMKIVLLHKSRKRQKLTFQTDRRQTKPRGLYHWSMTLWLSLSWLMTKRGDISPSGSRWECRKFSSLAFLLLYDKCLLDEEVKRPAIELHPGLCPKLFASLPRTGIPSVATADAFRKELCSVRWSPLDACWLEGLRTARFFFESLSQTPTCTQQLWLLSQYMG